MASPYGSSYDFGGTISANKYQWNDGIRRLDIMDDIILLSHTRTPLLGMLIDRTPLSNASPEWLQVTLGAIDTANSHAEGADYTFTDENVPARIQNVTQIFRKTAQVSGTSQAEDHVARITNLKEQQTQIRMREFMRDQQYAVINSTLSNTNEVTARTFRGILEAIRNQSNAGDGTGSTAFSETVYKEILQFAYDDNFQITDMFMTDKQYEIVNGFIGGPTVTADTTFGQRNVGAHESSYSDVIEEIGTVYGRVKHHLLRADYFADVTAGTSAPQDSVVFGLDMDFWHFRYLQTRSPFIEEPPKDGDRWRAVIQAEGTVVDDASGFAGGSYEDLA